jgi:hypothetical protein
MAGLWQSPRLESGFDKKCSKNAKISQNLTTWITGLFSRLLLWSSVMILETLTSEKVQSILNSVRSVHLIERRKMFQGKH